MCVWALIGFIVFFALGVGPVPYVYMGEVLPDEVKAPVSALCMGGNWLANSAIGLGFPLATKSWGLGGAFGVLAAVNVLASAFGLHLMVETRKRSLSDVHRLLMLRAQPGAPRAE